MISNESGKFLLAAARSVIHEYLKNKRETKPVNHPSELDQKKGIVVELYKKIGNRKELCGSSGILSEDKPLVEVCAQAAIGACSDKRFAPVELQDLPVILIHANIITSGPKQLFVKQPGEYLRVISPGQDGLVLQRGSKVGILMPHAILQNKWSTKEALENLSAKAGADKDAWMKQDAKIFTFQVQEFKEN